MLFVTKNDTEFLNITGLLPYTEYKFTIITQINGTDNPEKWSEPEYFIAKTKESSKFITMRRPTRRENPPMNSAVVKKTKANLS